MARITYNVELSSRPDRTGRSSVMVRLHKKGERPGRVLTSVKIYKASQYWNPSKDWGKWIIKHKNKDSLNEQVEHEYDRIKDQTEEWFRSEPFLTPALLAERFRSGSSELYFFHLDRVLIDAQRQAYATYSNKKTATKMLREWLGEDLRLESVNSDFVRRYQEFLRTSKMKNGQLRKGSTINRYLDVHHKLHKDILVKTGMSVRKAEQSSPWLDVEPLPEAKVTKGKLSESKIEQVAKITVDSRKRKLTPETAFHIWMLSHSLAGARFSDVMQLRYCQFEKDVEGNPVYLRYEMLKTGNKISMPVYDEARQLLANWWKKDAKPNEYVLPFLKNNRPYNKLLTHEAYQSAPFEVRRKLYNDLNHRNKQVNAGLKAIEGVASVDIKLRMHNSRHSFAAMAKRIMQEDRSLTIYDIQLMLGHSSYRTTEGYYRGVGDEDTASATAAIYNRKKGINH